MRLKPQLSHEVTIAKTATMATAPRGVDGHARERRRMARRTGRDVATHVAGDDHQRHLHGEGEQIPEAAAPGVDELPAGTPMPARPATTTTTVASSANTNASGSQRSVHVGERQGDARNGRPRSLDGVVRTARCKGSQGRSGVAGRLDRGPTTIVGYSRFCRALLDAA